MAASNGRSPFKVLHRAQLVLSGRVSVPNKSLVFVFALSMGTRLGAFRRASRGQHSPIIQLPEKHLQTPKAIKAEDKRGCESENV